MKHLLVLEVGHMLTNLCHELNFLPNFSCRIKDLAIFEVMLMQCFVETIKK